MIYMMMHDDDDNCYIPRLIISRYTLRVSGSGVHIVCENTVGLAWALSTLRQLLSHWTTTMCAATMHVARACTRLAVHSHHLYHDSVSTIVMLF